MKKSSASYILRIDDVCPTMKRVSFEKIRDACIALDIRPIIGVIPSNKDTSLVVDDPDPSFWDTIKRLADREWIIAQHGHEHIYQKNRKSEFVGLSYTEQYRKISQGKQILQEKLGIAPTWFMAPAHSFDDITCRVLTELSFTHITDGVALYPFRENGLTWVPQQLWKPHAMPFGLWTICLHPNTMTDQEIEHLIAFLTLHRQQFHTASLTPKRSLLTIPFRIAYGLSKHIASLY